MRIHIVTLNVEGDQVGAWATVVGPKAEALVAKLEAHYGDAEDQFVGVYIAEVELEAHIDDGPVSALGTPLIELHQQQSFFDVSPPERGRSCST
jgi:hypothetical protein